MDTWAGPILIAKLQIWTSKCQQQKNPTPITNSK
jgi:hypothetical protein